MKLNEEMQELIFLIQERDMLRLNKEIANHLRKVGVRLREFRWDELEAS